jgi:DNA helicase-2/ATP-dependent DNA helicase PcrA
MSALKPTQEQAKIINHLRGHCIVKAGPGCAKTSTLALRVKHLLNNNYDPQSMVLVTHSKALAADIQHTIEGLVGQRKAEQITVCTIHRFANQLVKANYHLLGMDQHPTLIQAEDKKQFIHDEAKRLDQTVKALSQAYAAPNKISAKERALSKSYEKYRQFKNKSNAVDYDDMLTNAVQLLTLAPKGLSLPYKHLMVDELQDINRQQKQLLLLLATRMRSTVMVGDPLQLIYGWRQASLRYWQDIERELKGLKHYTLTRSFRVPRQALPFINDIANMVDEDAPMLRSKVEGEAPELVDLINKDTGLWLAKEIKAWLAKGVAPDQIAILAKTRKELSQIALALRARNICITERYHQPDHDHHKRHLLALIQLARLEQLRANRPTKKLTSTERKQLSTYIDDLWLPGNLVRSLQKRARLKPDALLSVESGDKHYGEVNNMVNAIRTAASLPRVDSAGAVLD